MPIQSDSTRLVVQRNPSQNSSQASDADPNLDGHRNLDEASISSSRSTLSLERAASDRSERVRSGNLERFNREQQRAKITPFYLHQLLGDQIKLIPGTKEIVDPRPNVSYEVYSQSATSLQTIRNKLYRDYGIFTTVENNSLKFDVHAYNQLIGAVAGQYYERSQDQTMKFLTKVINPSAATYVTKLGQSSVTIDDVQAYQDNFNFTKDNIFYEVSVVPGQRSEVVTKKNINENDAKSQVVMALKLAMTETELVRWDRHAWKFTITCDSTNPRMVLQFIAEARLLGAGVDVDMSRVPESARDLVASEMAKANKHHDQVSEKGGLDAKAPSRIPSFLRRFLTTLGFIDRSSYSHMGQNPSTSVSTPRFPTPPPPPGGNAPALNRASSASVLQPAPNAARSLTPTAEEMGAQPQRPQTVTGSVVRTPSQEMGAQPQGPQTVTGSGVRSPSPLRAETVGQRAESVHSRDAASPAAVQLTGIPFAESIISEGPASRTGDESPVMHVHSTTLSHDGNDPVSATAGRLPAVRNLESNLNIDPSAWGTEVPDRGIFDPPPAAPIPLPPTDIAGTDIAADRDQAARARELQQWTTARQPASAHAHSVAELQTVESSVDAPGGIATHVDRSEASDSLQASEHAGESGADRAGTEAVPPSYQPSGSRPPRGR